MAVLGTIVYIISFALNNNAATPKPGTTRIAEKDGMVMVYVPAGEFLMGSADSDSQAYSNEKPQHQVALDAFWIDRTEVTNDMFTRFVSATSYKTDAEKLGSGYTLFGTMWSDVKGADWQHPGGRSTNIRGLDILPVVLVSWNDAKAYCEWAGRRLPTEAEWEKAARGTDGRIYPWGNQTATCEHTVMDDGSGNGCGKGNAAWTVGSRSKGISPYGSYDMAGNVWEWVADWYDEKYYDSSAAKRPNPQGPASGQYRVLRGGSWSVIAQDVRSAVRNRYSPENRNSNFGFRCAR
jgi:serine/threonine-protein kinase